MREALAPTLRTIPVLPVVASLGVALGICRVATGAGAVEPLRYGALVLALGAGFVLDDNAAPTIAAVPTTLAIRRALRLLLTLPVVIATWTIMLAIADISPLSPWAVSLELAGLLAVGLSVAALGTRDPAQQRGGLVAAPTVLAFFIAAGQLPGRWAPLPPPSTEQWATAHQRWAGILAAAIVVAARASRDER